MNLKLTNGYIVTKQNVTMQDVYICDGKISFNSPSGTIDKIIDINGKYVVPGFIDIHFHGYSLFEFTTGLYDEKKNKFDESKHGFQSGFEMLSRKMAGFGVTGFYLATIAAPVQRLKFAFNNLREFMSKQQNPDGSRILGGFLEGTFINKNMAGAQNPAYVFEPTKQVFDSIEDGGTIKLANVAPENPGACELVSYLTQKGVIVGAGHSLATGDQIKAAMNAGLKYWVHFLNGPTGHNYKCFDGGGAVETVLKSDELYAEQIVDGFHINPQYVRDVMSRKGIDKVIAVTDALYAAGSNLKIFDLGGIKGEVSEKNEYIQVAGKRNVLCSSMLTMDRAFSNILNWFTTPMQGVWNRLHPAFELEQALVFAAQACSTSPAALTGLNDLGSISEGSGADLCILDIAGSQGKYKTQVEMTMVDGKIVYTR
jgi:N-acetylglucosamine-6-phosphate deacetylase